MLILLSVLATNIARGDEAAPTPCVRFGVIADAQYADAEPGGSRHFRASLKKLETCVADFNRQKLAFVIQLGDLVDRSQADVATILAPYRKLKNPAYHVIGNHDAALGDTVRSVLKGKTPGYYDFAVGQWRFVVLDTSDLRLQSVTSTAPAAGEAQAIFDQLKTRNAPNAQTWNGGIGAHQKAWLKTVLTKAKKTGERAVVFSHMPLYPSDVHNPWNVEDIIPILENSKCVAACFAGHNHAGRYAQKNGIHYLTLEGMIETPDQTAYAVVEIYPDRIQIQGRGRVPTRILTLPCQTK